MREPTLTEMATVCDFIADEQCPPSAGEIEKLHAAARILRSINYVTDYLGVIPTDPATAIRSLLNKLDRAEAETFNWLIAVAGGPLRAMQAQEQSAATPIPPSGGTSCEHSALAIGPAADPPFSPHGPHPADPPPPEDALLADLNAWLDDSLGVDSGSRRYELIQRARDRIAADGEARCSDAHEIAKLVQVYKDCADSRDQLRDDLESKLAAAEARAQGLEAAMKEADKKLAGMWSWNEDGRSKMLHTWFGQASSILRAALARPEPGCEHEWVSADNEKVQGCDICITCRALRVRPEPGK